MNIGMSFMESDSATYGSNSRGEMIELEDRTIVPSKDKMSVEMYMEEGIMMISGDMSQEEMIRIAKRLIKA